MPSLFLKGTVSVASADNPASQLLGSFKDGSAAFRKCRQCMTTSDTMCAKVCWCDNE